MCSPMSPRGRARFPALARPHWLSSDRRYSVNRKRSDKADASLQVHGQKGINDMMS